MLRNRETEHIGNITFVVQNNVNILTPQMWTWVLKPISAGLLLPPVCSVAVQLHYSYTMTWGMLVFVLLGSFTQSPPPRPQLSAASKARPAISKHSTRCPQTLKSILNNSGWPSPPFLESTCLFTVPADYHFLTTGNVLFNFCSSICWTQKSKMIFFF